MDTQKHLKTAEIVANLLDNKFNIFGMKFGLNALLDLIPEIGDVISLVLSLYLVWLGIRMNIPRAKIAQMYFNILVNFFIGLIPVIGDVAYIFNKANLKNLQILKKHAESQIVEGKIVQ